MSASVFQLVQALQAAIDQLNKVLLGTSAETVTINGTTKPTISKAIADAFSSLFAMANGLKGFETLAALTASGAPAAGAGALAWVTNDPTPTANGIYRWSGSVWVASSYDRYTVLSDEYRAADVALGARIDGLNVLSQDEPVYDNSGLPVAFAVTDEAGRTAVIVRTDGSVWLKSIELLNGGSLQVGQLAFEQRSDAELLSGVVWGIVDDADQVALGVTPTGSVLVAGAEHEAMASGVAWAVTDELGSAAVLVQNDGKVIIPLLESSDEPITPPTPVPTSLKSMANHRTDYMHLFTYGQSLSRGSTATPVISTAQPHSNVTFQSGVMPRGTDSSVDYSAFKPLVEETYETPTSGTLNRLVDLMVADGEDASKWHFMGTAPGQGGQSIQNLHKGTIYWSYMMEQVAAAQALAAAAGRSYSVWGMTWTQGEANYSLNNTVQEYYDLLIKMKEDFAADVSSITKQDFKPPLVCYQVAAHRRYSRDHCNVAIAQWLASRADPDIIMACAMYALPYNTDNLHLTADSSRQLGRYYARAFHEAVVLGKGDWRPLEPTSVLWQGRIIDIQLHVPHGPLQWDTTIVAEAPNKGFDVWSAGAPLTDIISSVEIVDGGRVRVVLSYDPPGDATLTYARGRPGDPNTAGPVTGPRGNLRDSHGAVDNYVDSTGATRYMHNWCVIFQYVINQGAI